MPDSPLISGTQLGASTLLVTFDYLYNVFAPYGFTEIGFRNFLKALGNAAILMPDGRRLYHYFKFLLSIEIATELGAKDFQPAATRTAKGDHRQFSTTRRSLPVDLPAMSASLERAIGILLAARKYPGHSNPPAVTEALGAAAQAMIAQISRAQAAGIADLHESAIAETLDPRSRYDHNGPRHFTEMAAYVPSDPDYGTFLGALPTFDDPGPDSEVISHTRVTETPTPEEKTDEDL